jgi:hypothetical protein
MPEDCAKEYLNGQGIDLIGRFRKWDDLWSDQSYLSGKMKGEKIVQNRARSVCYINE